MACSMEVMKKTWLEDAFWNSWTFCLCAKVIWWIGVIANWISPCTVKWCSIVILKKSSFRGSSSLSEIAQDHFFVTSLTSHRSFSRDKTFLWSPLSQILLTRNFLVVNGSGSFSSVVILQNIMSPSDCSSIRMDDKIQTPLIQNWKERTEIRRLRWSTQNFWFQSSSSWS